MTVDHTIYIHAPADDAQDQTLAELRAALSARGADVTELSFEETEDGGRWFHVLATVQAVAPYEARRMIGPELMAAALDRIGRPTEPGMIAVSFRHG